MSMGPGISSHNELKVFLIVFKRLQRTGHERFANAGLWTDEFAEFEACLLCVVCHQNVIIFFYLKVKVVFIQIRMNSKEKNIVRRKNMKIYF